MSRVSIVKCADYDPGRVEDAVRQSILLAGGLDGIVRTGSKVLLKVNMSFYWPPESHATVHPGVIAAAAKVLREAGAEVTIGDSIYGYSGMVRKRLRGTAKEKLKDCSFEELDKIHEELYCCESSADFLKIRLPGGSPLFGPGDLDLGTLDGELFDRAGMTMVSGKTGAGIVLFDNAEHAEVPNPGGTFLTKVRLTRVPLEADAVISLQKLKAHSQLLFFGAINNSFGMVPGPIKERYHRASRMADRAGEMLVDIFQLVKPQFALTDGIISTEGNGPEDGLLRNIGIISASRDSVALDSVCASVIGYDPMEIGTIRIAAERGLGTADPGKIGVSGTPVEEVRVSGFKKPDRVRHWQSPGA